MASAWFQAKDYFYNKLDQMIATTDPDYTQDQLVKAFNDNGYTIAGTTDADIASAADQLERHFNEYGNAENVSPNNYFDVATYKANKLIQLGTTTQTPPAGYSSWDEQALDVAMKDAGLSYWDHYMLYGMAEGINPSEQFNTDEYLTAKMDQLNALQPPQALPDGSFGTWTREDVIEAFQEADVNPIEHYFDYGMYEEGLDFTPGEEPGPDVPGVDYADVNLADMENPVVGTEASENFIGTVGGANATINQDTQIDGAGGENMLTANMNGNFAGFKTADALQNIDAITLNNATKLQRTFNAQNTGDVQTWNLNEQNAPVSISNLAKTGVTVNINGLAGNSTSAIGFASNATAGDDDAMTIGVNGLGNAAVGTTIKEKDANIRMSGIERVTLNAEGDNFINLSLVTDLKDLSVTGDGNLKVVSAASSVESFDASEATGKLNVNLGNSADFQTATLGSQDDVLIVSGVNETSTFDGGGGADKVIMQNLNGSYRLNMQNVEILQVDGIDTNAPNAGTVTLSGTHTDGLETLVINATDPMAGTELVLGEYNASELTVQTICAADQGIKGLSPIYQGTVKIADVQDVTLQVGDADKVKENFNGVLDLNAAENVSVKVGGTLGNGDSFTGTIKAPNATSLSIDMNRYSGGFSTTANSQLANVSQIEVTGYGPVDLSAASTLGASSRVVSVDASSLENTFKASFGTNQEDAILSIAGSSLSGNEIDINGNYSSLTVTGGIQRDVVRLNVDALADNAVLDIDLGMGANQLYVQGDIYGYLGVSGSDATAQNAAVDAWLQSAFNGTVTRGNTHVIDAFEANGRLLINDFNQRVTVGNDITGVVSNSDPVRNEVLDMTNISFVGGNNGLEVQGVVGGTYNSAGTALESGSLSSSSKPVAQTLIFGETGDNGASAKIASNSVTITTVNATGANSVVNIDATADTTAGKFSASSGGTFQGGPSGASHGGAMIEVGQIAGGATVNIDITHSSDENYDQIQIGSVVGVTEPNTWGVVRVKGFEVHQKASVAAPAVANAYQGDKICLAGQYSRLGEDPGDLEYMLDNAGIEYDADSFVRIYEAGTKGVSHAFSYTYGGVSNTVIYGVASNPGSPTNGFGATMVILEGVSADDLAVKNGSVYNSYIDTPDCGGFIEWGEIVFATA